MKKYGALIACIAGVAGLIVLLPWFDHAQPQGLSITRDQARSIADKAALEFGIEVDRSWVLTTWEESPILEKELRRDPERRRRALSDPMVGKRLSYFRVTYFRKGLEKFPPYGQVLVGKQGAVLGVRRTARNEMGGARPAEEVLRPKADAFIAGRDLPGSPRPRFESARPNQLNSRTDYTFRYRVPTDFPSGNVVYFVYVYFVGDQLAGWEPIEEYADGSRFRFEAGDQIVGTFIQYFVLFSLLLALLIIFLRKYHAGEVGVGTGAFLLGAILLLILLQNLTSFAESSFGFGFGGADARTTAFTFGGFYFLFYSIPFSVLLFLGWSVGESYARERWGARLASFDALLRREKLNATVGRSLLNGLLTAPAVAAASLLPAVLGISASFAYADPGNYTGTILGSAGGSTTVLAEAAIEAISAAVIPLLFVLALFNRKRMLWLGLIVAAVTGAALGLCSPPIGPALSRVILGFGAVVAAAAVFLAYDLLCAAVAFFGGTLFVGFLPYLRAAEGSAMTQPALTLIVPLAGLLVYAAAGLLTGREVQYEYSDLAPHVKRIIERERVKAEIDAANRIQSALLPTEAPRISGASVASHYRSATEIGGDYFDFLPLHDGSIGLAFGDVAGHGLTSGIVMAMAKSALLVQVGYDSTPRRVMEVLNDTVLRTAPKRMMMTFFFGILDPHSHRLEFSTAGHLDPYVYRAQTGRIEALSAWGFPLGIRRRDPFPQLTVDFSAGDRLILYSDGLIEAIDDDGEPFGFHRFENVLRETGGSSAEAVKKAVLDSVRRFTRNRPPEDDQTLVVVAFDGTAAERVRGLERSEPRSDSLLATTSQVSEG